MLVGVEVASGNGECYGGHYGLYHRGVEFDGGCYQLVVAAFVECAGVVVGKAGKCVVGHFVAAGVH